MIVENLYQNFTKDTVFYLSCFFVIYKKSGFVIELPNGIKESFIYIRYLDYETYNLICLSF